MPSSSSTPTSWPCSCDLFGFFRSSADLGFLPITPPKIHHPTARRPPAVVVGQAVVTLLGDLRRRLRAPEPAPAAERRHARSTLELVPGPGWVRPSSRHMPEDCRGSSGFMRLESRQDGTHALNDAGEYWPDLGRDDRWAGLDATATQMTDLTVRREEVLAVRAAGPRAIPHAEVLTSSVPNHAQDRAIRHPWLRTRIAPWADQIKEDWASKCDGAAHRVLDPAPVGRTASAVREQLERLSWNRTWPRDRVRLAR